MSDSESWTSGLINEQLRKRFENHDTAKVTNLASQACIAANMPQKTNIVFEGKAGDNFGGLNNGSKEGHMFSVGDFNVYSGGTGGSDNTPWTRLHSHPWGPGFSAGTAIITGVTFS